MLLAVSSTALAACPPGQVVQWGMNFSGGATGVEFPDRQFVTGKVSIAGLPLTNAQAIAAGTFHALARRQDGTMVGWGLNASGQVTGFRSRESGSTNGPVLIGGRPLSDIVAAAAGRTFSLALRRDGTTICWGENRSGEAMDAPPLKRVVAVAAKDEHALALKGDGTVAVWGRSNPAPAGLSNVVAVATGGESGRNLALRTDGTVMDWPVLSAEYISTVPRGLSNITAISAGGGHSLALKADGTVVGWGANNYGQATGAPTEGFPHESTGTVRIAAQTLRHVIAISAGGEFSLALKKDGTVVSWGHPFAMQMAVPAGLSNVVAIAAGENFCLAITTNLSQEWGGGAQPNAKK